MGDMGDYWRDYREYVKKERRAELRAKLPGRIQFVAGELKKRGYDFTVCNLRTGQINVRLGKKTFTFYCGTGKITNYGEKRGYRAFLAILERKSIEN